MVLLLLLVMLPPCPPSFITHHRFMVSLIKRCCSFSYEEERGSHQQVSG